MKLTSKGRYAVTAMLDVALHSKRGPVPLADISERQEISLSYLEQLFSRLRKEQLVDSVRGPGGVDLVRARALHVPLNHIDPVRHQVGNAASSEVPEKTPETKAYLVEGLLRC